MAYEYNAPSHYVDFTSGSVTENDEADNFFLVEELVKLNIETQSSEGDQASTKEDEPEASSSEEATIDGQEVDSEKENQQISNKGNGLNIERCDKKRKARALTPVGGGPPKFISLAEGVQMYSKLLTNRFNSHAGGSLKRNGLKQRHVTIPQSPLLLTKERSRPVFYQSSEEREDKIVQEMKSYKLKANPVNEKIFKKPVLGTRVLPKKTTVVEPFNLTEFKKKESDAVEELFYFKASEIPRGLLEHTLGVPDKLSVPATKAITPSFLKSAKYKRHVKVIEEVDGENCLVEKDVYHTGVMKAGSNLSGNFLLRTEMKPFSFEERDKQLLKNKEEKVKKVLEEEKKAREFHANPLPRFIKSRLNSTCVSPGSSSASNSSLISLDGSQPKPFKAQPADVIHKKPFVPKKAEQPIVLPLSIKLNTETRAKERKKFDEEMEKTLEMRENILQQRREIEARKEEEEIWKLRKEAVHKAAKIRVYKPVPEAAKKTLTAAESPCFSGAKTT